MFLVANLSRNVIISGLLTFPTAIQQQAGHAGQQLIAKLAFTSLPPTSWFIIASNVFTCMLVFGVSEICQHAKAVTNLCVKHH